MTRPDGADTVGRWTATVERTRTLDGAAFQESVDAMLAELEQLAPGSDRSRMAEDLIRLLLSRLGNRDNPVLCCLDRLTQIGDENSPDRPGWQRIRAVGRLVALLRAAGGRELVDYRAAMYEVDRLAKEFADDPGIRSTALIVQAVLAQAADPNDVATLHGALAEIGTLLGGDSEVAPLIKLMAGLVPAVQAIGTDDGAALTSYLELVKRARDLPDTAAGAAVEVTPVLELLQSLVAGVPDSDLDVFDHRLDMLQEFADRPGIAATQRAHILGLRGGVTLRQGAEQDPVRLSAAIADLRTAVTQTSEDHPDHVSQLVLLAWALSRRSEVTDTAGDDEAITLLERARELAGGPGHPDWSAVNDMLAQLRRRRGGDKSQSQRIALEGLRGHAWQVLLQPDPISARVVARSAAEGATMIATQLLGDGQPVDALRALDAGRGLMLFAATELRDPCTRLIEAGRPELAEQWRAEQHPSPPLRQDVVEVLARDAGLLDPPDLAEIQAALRALDADALIYLVPATLCGWAVIAPVEGPPRYLTLPHLVIEDGTDIERYLAAMAARDGELVARSGESADAREVGDIGQAEFAGSVERLCEWAWKAAMGPIITPYMDADRVPHLILVPMGDLARVPWQAARGPDGRYLVERVALSQAVSARMLCDTAAADSVRLTLAGLVVGDPDTGGQATDLPAARLEAYAIRESFYPGATYLGRLPRGTVSSSGAGTPDDVRAWLRADGAEAGAMLHLASHGVMETALGRASSRLVLAGGDLTADELIGVLADSTRHRISLVVLAGCHTGRSIHGYDEAYSLATMFLATGVRSVLSTQWSVPDSETSLLMYMFHHYLVTERRQPWDALRRAQIWMLDGARTVPARMPEPLRRALRGSDPRRVVAWAGFVHWGQ